MGVWAGEGSSVTNDRCVQLRDYSLAPHQPVLFKNVAEFRGMAQDVLVEAQDITVFCHAGKRWMHVRLDCPDAARYVVPDASDEDTWNRVKTITTHGHNGEVLRKVKVSRGRSSADQSGHEAPGLVTETQVHERLAHRLGRFTPHHWQLLCFAQGQGTGDPLR